MHRLTRTAATRLVSRAHWRARLGPLGDRRFRLLFAGRSVSMVGSSFEPIALAFAVVYLTGSPADLGLVMAATVLPNVAFLLIGGVWADRLPRGPLLVASYLVSGGLQGLVALLLLTGTAEIWHLALVAAGRGVVAAFSRPAFEGIVPHTVSPEHLQQANGLLTLVRSGSTVGGAALAGILVAAIGPGWTIALDAITYVAGAVCLAFLSLPKTERRAQTRFVAELAAGWDEVRSRPWLIGIIVQFAIVNAFALTAFVVLGPFLAEGSLGGPAAWGLVLAAQAAGMLCGGIVSLRYRPERPLVAATLAMLPTAALLALLGAAAPLYAIASVAFVAGACSDIGHVLWTTTLQREIPPDRLSRVFAYDAFGSFALIPVGTMIVGPIAVAIGTAETFAVAAALVVIPTLAVLALADVRRLRQAPPEPHAGAVGVPAPAAP